MDSVLMCGGRGTRLRPAVGDTEKPLVEIGGRPMVDHVVAALHESQVETIVAAVSPQSPETAASLRDTEGVRVIETPGEGYVADLTTALAAVETPAVTITADLPLVTGSLIDRAIETAAGESLTVCVPLSLTEAVGTSADTTVDHESQSVVPTGLNIVGDGSDQRVVWEHTRLACNVNRPPDLRRAKQLFGELE